MGTKLKVLTVVRHADLEALVEAAVLALIAGDAHDDAAGGVLARLVLDLLLHRPTKEPLQQNVHVEGSGFS